MGPSVEIPASAWQPAAEDGSRLITTVVVNGLPLHLEAIEVSTDEYGIQRGCGDADESLATIHEVVGAEGHWQTVTIGGRDYVLIASPYT